MTEFRMPQQVGPNQLSWAFDAAEAKRRQAAADAQTRRRVDLGNGLSLELVLIPIGEFAMANGNDGDLKKSVRIEKAF